MCKSIKYFRLLLCFIALWVLSGCGQSANTSYEVEATIQSGVEALRIFDFEGAYQILSEVQPQVAVADTALWELATYSLALACWHQSPPSQEKTEMAQSYLRLLLTTLPDSKFAPTAQLELGRIDEIVDYPGDIRRINPAREHYKSVRENYAGTDMENRATLFLAQTYAETLQIEDVQYAVDLLEADLPELDDAWKGVFAQYLAQLYAFYLRDTESAIAPYQMAVEAGLPRVADADVSLWQLGLLAESVGDGLTAADAFIRLMNEHPRSVYTTVAREHIIELADTYPDAAIRIPPQPEASFGRD